MHIFEKSKYIQIIYNFNYYININYNYYMYNYIEQKNDLGYLGCRFEYDIFNKL